MTEIELQGVEVFGHHGVLDEERREGQRFLFDVTLRLAAEPRADELDQTVDYRAVASCVREVSDRRPVQLLETLAAAVADELMIRFAPAGVRVRVRKPEVQLDRRSSFPRSRSSGRDTRIRRAGREPRRSRGDHSPRGRADRRHTPLHDP
jgi:dihydroneopterin aldolase